MTIIATIILIIGIYLIFQADRCQSRGSQAVYAIVGLLLAMWGLLLLFRGSVSFSLESPAVIFAVFALLAFYTKGTAKAISGAVAIIIFLSIVL